MYKTVLLKFEIEDEKNSKKVLLHDTSFVPRSYYSI